MQNVMTLKAESRTEVGKQVAKKLRKQGRIPAIIYGEKKDSIPISLDINDVKTILKSEMGENAVLRIHRDDIQVDAMVKEIQLDYLSDNVIHLDLIRIDLNKKVTIAVPVKVNGVPVGVKVEGGLFDFMTREVRVRCLPTQIPTEFAIDVSEMHAGQSIKAEDLELEEDIKLVSAHNAVICAVSLKGAEEEEAEEEEEVAVAAEEEAAE